jgi:hypothetical protein
MSEELRHGQILTPETSPDHWAIGHLYRGWDGKVYYCDSYEHPQGFWMTEVDNESNRRNVSFLAVGGTFHKVHDDPTFTPTFEAVAEEVDEQGRAIRHVVMDWEPWNLLGRRVLLSGKPYRILQINADTSEFRKGDVVAFRVKELDQ